MSEENKVAKGWKPQRYTKIFAADQEEITRQFCGIHGSKIFAIWVRLNSAGFNSAGKFFPEPTWDLHLATGLDNKTIYQSIKRLESASFIEVIREKKPGNSLNEINQFRLLRGASTCGKNNDKYPQEACGKKDENFPTSSLTITKEGGLQSQPPNSLDDSIKKKTHGRRSLFANSGDSENPANAKAVAGTEEQTAGGKADHGQ